MPSAEEILTRLAVLANAWQGLAVFWHVYFAGCAAGLVAGVRPAKRLCGILLALPLLSVSVVAWLSSNPFNGTVFTLVGASAMIVSVRLPDERVRMSPGWTMSVGIIMFIFGWVYPHFLEAASFVSYLYAAPTGLIPCPTLSIVIGLTLVLGRLDSRAFSLILGGTGLFYGLTGVFQLGVLIDWFLFIGSVVTVGLAYAGKRWTGTSERQPTP